MSINKQFKDYLIKHFWNGKYVPVGLLELDKYFRHNGAINFDFKRENGKIIAISKDFRQGSIITSAVSEEELDENIKDAIMTIFEVPSAYKKDAGIHKIGRRSEDRAYAIA